MRICIISSMIGSPWAGSEMLWAATAHAALDDGHEVAVVVKRWPRTPAPAAELEARGARMFFRGVDLRRRSSRIFERILGPLPALASWRPDAVYVSQGSFLELEGRNDIYRILRSFGAPYVVVSQQNFEGGSAIPSDAERHRMASYFRGAYRAGFVSERNRISAEVQLAADIPNACVVRNPVNLADLAPVEWPSGDEARMACVARLDADHKGQDILISVLAEEPWRSRPWSLNLYGDGRHRDYFKELVGYHGLSDRVRFRGHVGDLREVWADNQIQLMPSRCEGTPLALIEAMLCGRPAVVTDVGGHKEWISEPRNGFIAEAPSPTSFGAALERAWGARDSWKAMGEIARRDALAQIDPDPGRTILRMLAEAAEAGRPTPFPI